MDGMERGAPDRPMDGMERPGERGGLNERPPDGRDMTPRWPLVGARYAPVGLPDRDGAAMPRLAGPAPERPMADPREPVDGAGPLSMADGRVLAWGAAAPFAEALPTVPEGPVR
jgi:hypothetical protein